MMPGSHIQKWRIFPRVQWFERTVGQSAVPCYAVVSEPDVSRKMIVSQFSTSMFSAFLMRFATILAVLFFWHCPIVAQDAAVNDSVTIDALSMGFNGVGRVGNWLPVRVKVHGLTALQEFTLTVIASDPRGDQCESKVATGTSDATGMLEIRGVFMTGRLDGSLRLRLDDAEGKTHWQHLVPCRAVVHSTETESSDAELSAPVVAELKLLRHRSRTVLVAGTPAGLAELNQELAANESTRDELSLLRVGTLSDFPDTRRGLDSVDTVLLVTEYGLSDKQTEAIREWVLTGGTLLVSCGEHLPQFLASPVGQWLQPLFGIDQGLLASKDLTAIQNYVSGASQLQTNRYDVPIVRLSSDQPRIVVNSINGPLISRISSGAGVITMVAVDLNLKPLDRWLSLSDLYETLLFGRILEVGTEQARRSRKISSSGVTDIATQLANAADAIPANERWSSWHAMLMMLVYLAVIGPLDYLLVVRLLQRPRLTWLTFPLMLAMACGLTLWWSGSQRAAATVRQIHLLDVSQGESQQFVRTRSWSSLSTSESRYGSVSVSDFQPAVTSVGVDEKTLMWHGRSEDVYGGLYRPGGAGLGQQSTRRTEVGEAKFTSVPLMADGSQAFLAESFSGSGESPLFISHLQMPGTGLLEGNFEHHLPGAIRDWVIVFGNRAYLPSDKSDDEYRRIEPGEKWTRQSGQVRIAEIRDFLRGIRIISGERKNGSSTSTSTQIQAEYNVNGKNPFDILMMTSLYESAGAEIYVKLKNEYHKRDEVSTALQLNTALLIGVIDTPLSRLGLDDQAIEPAATATVVRLFLPVKRASGSNVPTFADPNADPASEKSEQK